MDESRKTILFASTALALVLIAWISSPGRITPDVFTDQGDPFFPDFEDPNEAASLEVIDFNSETGIAIPFKVVNKGGLWSIPSHNGYPADGKERLAKTAAGVIDIKRDDFRTANVAEYEACGVVDPLDETATDLGGRGQRVTVRGPNEQVLADFILGRDVPARSGFRFVRVPGEKRVYAARIDVEISTRFADWIETDLLQLEKFRVGRIVIDDYSVNERNLSIDRQDELTLTRSGRSWSADQMKKTQIIDSITMADLLSAIDSLQIVGVRLKPKGFSEQLGGGSSEMTMSQADMRSMQSHGFYLSTDGRLLANKGELRIDTDQGVVYTLRFGEVLFGSGTALTAGTSAEGGGSDLTESRYLFVTALFDADKFKEPTKPEDETFRTRPDSLWNEGDRENKKLYDKWSQWEQKVESGKELTARLNARFADWYYVISSESFEELHPGRDRLVVDGS